MKRFVSLACFLLLSAAARAADESPLHVAEMTVCQEVVDRACQAPSSSFGADISSVYCLSRIDGATGEATVTHVWTFEGKEVRRVKLQVKGPSFRTWSSKRVKWLPGKWKVEVLDPLDRSIAVIAFTVERPRDGP